MQLFRKLDELPKSIHGGALTIGNFDGVHRGHARIIERLRHYAGELGGPAIVFTFDPHPVRLLRPDKAPPPLTWTNRKADLLAELGVDAVIAYPTNMNLLGLSYLEFFEQVICQYVGAKAMVEGPNFFFGKGREGSVEILAELCADREIQLEILQPVLETSDYISSSRIRELVRIGDVDAARMMLTQPYRIRGMVTHGAARGTKIGFPTANLDAIDTLIPAKGVYAGRTYVNQRPHWSAIHIGPNPTFGDQLLKVESHILDFEGVIYGQPVEVDFIAKLRDIRHFASVDELTEQLNADIESTRNVARSFPNP